MWSANAACASDASWALWLLGYPDHALQRSREGLTLAQDLSHPFSLTFALSFAAVLHQCRREGQAAQARAEAAMSLATDHGFVQWMALGTVSSLEAEAESCFQHALTIARRQHAKSWELRAAVSLSRLWQSQGKRPAAQQLLDEVYGWFTEGFDIEDLQEAKALLEELAADV